MRITANNPEQEEAEEVLDVTFEGDAIEIGFNVLHPRCVEYSSL